MVEMKGRNSVAERRENNKRLKKGKEAERERISL